MLKRSKEKKNAPCIQKMQITDDQFNVLMSEILSSGFSKIFAHQLDSSFINPLRALDLLVYELVV